MSCGGTGPSLSDSVLPVALRSRVKLVGERPLDRQSGEALTIELSGQVTEITRSERNARPHRVVIQTPERERPWILFMTLAEDVSALPFSAGEAIQLHYRARFAPRSLQTHRALSIRAADGQLLLAFQDDGLLTPEQLPNGLKVEANATPVYTEAGPLSRLCYTVVEHGRLQISDGLGTQTLVPGASLEVLLGADRWRVTAIDNSRTLKARCSDHQPQRLAWFVIRTAAEQ